MIKLLCKCLHADKVAVYVRKHNWQYETANETLKEGQNKTAA